MSIRYTLALALITQLSYLAQADDRPEGIVVARYAEVAYTSRSVIYKKKMLVVSNKDGVAAIMFDEPIAHGVTYRYRFLPTGKHEEQTGNDKVFEKYKTVASFLFFQFTEDDGGQGIIKAGPIELPWSMRCDWKNRESGWIYFDPTQIHVETADPKEFNLINLRAHTMSQ